MKMYFRGGKGIEKPLDFNGIEIKAGYVLTSDVFDPFFDEEFYSTHWPNWTKEDIEKRRNTATYIVKWNDKGFFYGEGISQSLYLHDFRFKYTKVIKDETKN